MRYRVSWQRAAAGVPEFLRMMDLLGQGFGSSPLQFDWDNDTGHDDFGTCMNFHFESHLPEIPDDLVHNLEVHIGTLSIHKESWVGIYRVPVPSSYVHDKAVYIRRDEDKATVYEPRKEKKALLTDPPVDQL